MSTTPPRKEILCRVEELVRDDPRVEFALVFGSVAREQAGPGSDLDVAVGLRRGGGEDHLAVKLELAGRLAVLADRVDVVLADDAPPALAYRIARDGVVAWARDTRSVTRFRALAFTRHPDWERFIAPHAEALKRRIEEESYGR
jgi:predicted nucleotidyltransferase